MVRPYREGATPEIGPPMMNCFDEANQLPLIRRKLGMVGRYSTAEEGHRTISLVEDYTKTSPGRVTVNDEALVEVRHL